MKTAYNYLNRQIVALDDTSPAGKARTEARLERFAREARAEALAGRVTACIALLAARRATNGYADLADLRAAAGIPDACHTEAESIARACAERDLHDVLVRRGDVVCREGRYTLRIQSQLTTEETDEIEARALEAAYR